jgi:hypothetical protein
MSMAQDTSEICRVCGKNLDQHFLDFYDSTAHAGSYDDAGRPRHCSVLYAERRGFVDDCNRLQTIIRSLRYRSGRLWRQGVWDHANLLSEYARLLEKDRERVLGLLKRWYTWEEKD